MRSDFACFILCHGRPNNTPTVDTLRKCGYTGKIYLICDDEDNKLDEYISIFGRDMVQIFNKLEILQKFDTMDSSDNRACAVYARNACFEIAHKLGLKYFCELDDDYKDFTFRRPVDDKLPVFSCDNLDEVFMLYIDLLNSNEHIYSLAFAQNGDYIGGVKCHLIQKGYKRKCMNSWICDVNKPFTFNGRMNDDVNTYTLLGSQGKIYLTLPDISVSQPETQSVSGGMTEMYVGEGTYVKSFYTVMCCPSFVQVHIMGWHNYRLHHSVSWNNACPKILSDVYKKK